MSLSFGPKCVGGRGNFAIYVTLSSWCALGISSSWWHISTELLRGDTTELAMKRQSGSGARPKIKYDILSSHNHVIIFIFVKNTFNNRNSSKETGDTPHEEMDTLHSLSYTTWMWFATKYHACSHVIQWRREEEKTSSFNEFCKRSIRILERA